MISNELEMLIISMMEIPNDYEGGALNFKNKQGQYHRFGGPAWIKYYENGIKEYTIYFEYDKHHRIGGPASIECYENGKVLRETYYNQGKQNRINGPAYIVYCKNGSIFYKASYENDKFIQPATRYHNPRKGEAHINQ